MKAIVDSALCAGRGLCYRSAPKVFSSDEDGFNAAVGGVVEVPEGRERMARMGASACPESAIQVVDDPGAP